jgi:hypothetical protein
VRKFTTRTDFDKKRVCQAIMKSGILALLWSVRFANHCPVDDTMNRTPYTNVVTEHALFLRLFVTNSGGW